MLNPICTKKEMERMEKIHFPWKKTLTSTKIPSLSNDTMAGSSEGTNLQRNWSALFRVLLDKSPHLVHIGKFLFV